MPNAVQAVESDGHGKAKLDEHLGQQRQSAERSRNRSRLKMPADDRGDQVGSGKNVESARGDRARDTVQTTGVPGDLRAVDGQVRRNRAIQALLSKDLGRVGGVGSGRRWSNIKAASNFALAELQLPTSGVASVGAYLASAPGGIFLYGWSIPHLNVSSCCNGGRGSELGHRRGQSRGRCHYD